ncbi:hypothetical protein Tco_0111984, partial [Tanacetum coccineum]
VVWTDHIPWASRFKRFLNRKRENRKWLLKALEDGPYVFRNITSTGSTIPRLQEVEDLQGDDLCHTPRRGLDGIRVRGRDVIIIRTQGTRERPLMDVLKIIARCIV